MNNSKGMTTPDDSALSRVRIAGTEIPNRALTEIRQLPRIIGSKGVFPRG
jgi:hypothetical protein